MLWSGLRRFQIALESCAGSSLRRVQRALQEFHGRGASAARQVRVFGCVFGVRFRLLASSAAASSFDDGLDQANRAWQIKPDHGLRKGIRHSCRPRTWLARRARRPRPLDTLSIKPRAKEPAFELRTLLSSRVFFSPRSVEASIEFAAKPAPPKNGRVRTVPKNNLRHLLFSPLSLI
jgi:hypothetical protein